MAVSYKCKCLLQKDNFHLVFTASLMSAIKKKKNNQLKIILMPNKHILFFFIVLGAEKLWKKYKCKILTVKKWHKWSHLKMMLKQPFQWNCIAYALP